MAGLMRNLIQRNGVYAVRVQLPADVRGAFGKTAEVRSLRTRDQHDALELAGPMIADIKRQIEKARRGEKSAPPPEPTVDVSWSPDDAYEAIQRWAKATIDEDYLRHFHGLAPTFNPFGDEAVALSERVYALQQRRFADIADFDSRLADALVGQGIRLTATHPAVPRLRAWFGEAWQEVEGHVARFRGGDFSEWSVKPVSAASDGPVTGAGVSGGVMPQSSVVTLTGAMDSFIAVARPTAKDESEIRGYVRRLVEHLGDIPIRDLTTSALDGFLIRLRKFPVTKRKDILRLPFDQIVDRHGDDETLPKLSNKTIRAKWFGAYNRIAKFAIDRDLMVKNPVTAAMPKKADDDDGARDPWTAKQVGEMFSKPLFTGAASLTGARDEPGELVQKDAKFWLPIIGLWCGMRLDEIGSLHRDELKKDPASGVWFFDLTNRKLSGPRRVKNAQSRRIVPVHKKLIDLGFITYAEPQTEWLFPDLPHGGDQPGDTTKHVGKWFGRWWRANGLVDPNLDQSFHSLRHNFKEACREAELAEDVHDRLTGHAGLASQKVSRNYGKVEIAFLSKSINKVRFPTFKLTA